MMRPRFSLRWLLIAFAVLAIAIYFFVRPTLTAHRFIATVQNRNFSQIIALVANNQDAGFEVFQEHWARRSEQVKMKATLRPRDSADTFSFRRRIEFSVSYLTRNASACSTETWPAIARGGSVVVEYNVPYYVH